MIIFHANMFNYEFYSNIGEKIVSTFVLVEMVMIAFGIYEIQPIVLRTQ